VTAIDDGVTAIDGAVAAIDEAATAFAEPARAIDEAVTAFAKRAPGSAVRGARRGCRARGRAQSRRATSGMRAPPPRATRPSEARERRSPAHVRV
jgi:hypothetical protein